jgi:hypothetical protein
LGHTPGLNFIYVHINCLIKKHLDGVGERSPEVREAACANFSFLEAGQALGIKESSRRYLAGQLYGF